MDEIDARICGLLMANSRVPLRELAERLGLSLQAVHRRIQVMQGQGVIKGFPTSLSLSYLNAVVVYIFGPAAPPPTSPGPSTSCAGATGPTSSWSPASTTSASGPSSRTCPSWRATSSWCAGPPPWPSPRSA